MVGAVGFWDYQYRDTVVWDGLRLISIFTALFIISLLVALATRRRRLISVRGDRVFSVGVMIYGVVALTQEAQQLGKDVLWWRLPLFLLGNVLVLMGLIYRMTSEIRREEARRADTTSPEVPGFGALPSRERRSRLRRGRAVDRRGTPTGDRRAGDDGDESQ